MNSREPISPILDNFGSGACASPCIPSVVGEVLNRCWEHAWCCIRAAGHRDSLPNCELVRMMNRFATIRMSVIMPHIHRNAQFGCKAYVINGV